MPAIGLDLVAFVRVLFCWSWVFCAAVGDSTLQQIGTRSIVAPGLRILRVTLVVEFGDGSMKTMSVRLRLWHCRNVFRVRLPCAIACHLWLLTLVP